MLGRRRAGGGEPGEGGAPAEGSQRRGCRKKKHRRLKKKLTCGPHTSVSIGREATGVFWAIQKYGGLQVGPRASKTYKMSRFKETKNYNGKFQNR